MTLFVRQLLNCSVFLDVMYAFFVMRFTLKGHMNAYCALGNNIGNYSAGGPWLTPILQTKYWGKGDPRIHIILSLSSVGCGKSWHFC